VLAYPVGGDPEPLRGWGRRRGRWGRGDLEVAEAGYVDLWKCGKARAIAGDVDPETVGDVVETGETDGGEGREDVLLERGKELFNPVQCLHHRLCHSQFTFTHNHSTLST